jgi:septation ring formation regulator EzrA
MRYIICENFMSEDLDTTQNPDIAVFVFKDLSDRVRNLETNLPSRVQAVEGAVDEIRRDLKQLHLETRQASERNEESISNLGVLLKDSTKNMSDKHSSDISSLGDKLEAVARRFAFIGGIWTTVALVASATVIYHKEIIIVLSSLGS